MSGDGFGLILQVFWAIFGFPQWFLELIECFFRSLHLRPKSKKFAWYPALGCQLCYAKLCYATAAAAAVDGLTCGLDFSH